jgi:hypothetical protein
LIGGLGVNGFGGETQNNPCAALTGNLFRGVVQFDPAAMLLEHASDDGEA